MQAVVNIGAVIGVFPITGVPLPLVSQGLSSVLVTMVGLGMLMSFARREPGASQALAARGPGVGSRVLSWLSRGMQRDLDDQSRGVSPAGRRARSDAMRVVLAGGGSAGHIEPALALADALRQADSSIQVTCLGTARGLETRLVPLRGYDLELIPAVPLPRSVTPQLLTVPGRLAGAVHGVGTILDRVGADVLVGFGGYVATPAYLAAKRHKVPIVVHEANPLPGIANRLGAHLTTHVFTGHPDTKLRNAVPGAADQPADRRARPVRAGRQGAGALRAPARPAGAARLRRLAGRHVAEPGAGGRGRRDHQRRGAGAARHRAQAPERDQAAARARCRTWPCPYVDRMDLAYAAADFALCRARRDDVRRAHRRGPARRLRPAAASATASSA